MLLIQTSQLKAALPCAAKNDIRYYLNAVCIQARGKSLYIVSTDGHCLFAGYLGKVSDLIPETSTAECAGEILIPADAVKSAIRLAGKAKTVAMEYLESDRYTLGDITFSAIDGKFPDWVRVTPAQLTDEPASFDLDILVRCRDALREWIEYGKRQAFVPSIQSNGPNGSALITAGECGAYCVVMPFRSAFEPSSPFAPESCNPQRLAA